MRTFLNFLTLVIKLGICLRGPRIPAYAPSGRFRRRLPRR